jgi:hypothetical protein
MNGWTRVLHLAAESREATPRKGTCSTSTIIHEVKHTYPWGGI